MTNEVGKAMFSKAGELGVPVGFMCMKVFLILSYYLWKIGLQLFVLLLCVCVHVCGRGHGGVRCYWSFRHVYLPKNG